MERRKGYFITLLGRPYLKDGSQYQHLLHTHQAMYGGGTSAILPEVGVDIGVYGTECGK